MKTALVKFLKWLVGKAAGKALLKALIKASLIVFFLFGMAGLGLLPASPFRMAFLPLQVLIEQIPYFRYVMAFLPFEIVIPTLFQWVHAIMIFHTAKFMLRQAKFIK